MGEPPSAAGVRHRLGGAARDEEAHGAVHARGVEATAPPPPVVVHLPQHSVDECCGSVRGRAPGDCYVTIAQNLAFFEAAVSTEREGGVGGRAKGRKWR